jgi:hypothetical protein
MWVEKVWEHMLLGHGRYDGDAGVSVRVPQKGCRSDKTAPSLGKGFARTTVDPQEGDRKRNSGDLH